MHQLQVLVLSCEVDRRSGSLPGAARSIRFATAFATSLRQLETLARQHPLSVLVYDLDGFGGSPHDVFATSVKMGIPAIVVAEELDPAQWIDLFHLGACDVLRGPVSPAELHRSIAAAAETLQPGPAGGAGDGEPWHVRIGRWGRKLLQPSAETD